MISESKGLNQQKIARLRARCHNRIPIICLAKPHSTVKIDRCKFLVPSNMMYAEFKYILQKHLLCQSMNSLEYMGKNTTLHLYVKDVVPKSQTYMGELYKKYHSEEGILYLTYSNEYALG